jgi:flagellar basal body rod protein FlgG
LILLRRWDAGDAGVWGAANGCRAFTWDVTASGANAGTANSFQNAFDFYVANIDNIACAAAPQQLQYSRYGSTVFEQKTSTIIGRFSQRSDRPTVLQKSLEASNASMTQSVPELSLAQKLFSALTKVLQTKQTNVDGVLNLVR